uniref:Uncharacterized protein n=1 Tax=Anguilla anguilla TaxID=7936 RepID=A0A0E9PSL2_ANGAN
MCFQTPANSLKFTPPLLSLSNMDMIDRTVTGLKVSRYHLIVLAEVLCLILSHSGPCRLSGIYSTENLDSEERC